VRRAQCGALPRPRKVRLVLRETRRALARVTTVSSPSIATAPVATARRRRRRRRPMAATSVASPSINAAPVAFHSDRCPILFGG